MRFNNTSVLIVNSLLSIKQTDALIAEADGIIAKMDSLIAGLDLPAVPLSKQQQKEY
jgi:hypothetical protein